MLINRKLAKSKTRGANERSRKKNRSEVISTRDFGVSKERRASERGGRRLPGSESENRGLKKFPGKKKSSLFER